jgi:hypothetical protein
MITGVLSEAFLLAILLWGQGQLVAQQSRPEDLPEPPQPSPSQPIPGLIPEQPMGNAGDRPMQGAVGQGQSGSSRPGFPPVLSPTPGRVPVPADSRRNIPSRRPECRPDSSSGAERFMSCQPEIPMFARFLNSSAPLPLTPRQKFILFARNVSDPFNLLTIGAVSAYSVATDAHTADGPGFPGFARNAGVSLTQDMVGEFFGTFLIPSLAHQDPHYHRMPNLPVRRRILHAIDAVVIAQSDTGQPMFNYATVFGTVGTYALGNLYVPGRSHSLATNTAQISISLATDPTGNLVTEFLPDVARRINFQVVFVQRLINRIAIEEGASSSQ